MTDYEVTMTCSDCGTREVYSVKADSADDAREHWTDGTLVLTEVSGLEITEVQEVES